MGKLTYTQPASNWNEALPIGCGRIGAMIFGEPGYERIQLNEDSIWYGGPQERPNPDAYNNLGKVREFILKDGNLGEAENLLRFAFSGTPQSERPYETAGDMNIEWNTGKPLHYSRELLMEEGCVRVSFETQDDNYVKEYIASYPDQVLAIKTTAKRKGRLSLNILLTRGRFYETVGRIAQNAVYLGGQAGPDGVKFQNGVAVKAINGTVRQTGERLFVENADSVEIFIAMETSFYNADQYESKVAHRLQNALDKGYDAIRRDQRADYKELFDRVSFSLGKDDKSESLSFVENYYQFVRYLCISASRPGSLPANLQGIWNQDMTPAWDSKYTININTEMNYWPIETANLSECHMPLFDLLKRMDENGKVVAQKMYHCRGFVAHHNTDMWADCAPQDIWLPATYWVMGGAWLSTHIWTHYCHTLDQEFLRDMYYVLKDAVLFFHDFLIEDQGELITCPSVSPENTYILPNGQSGRVCAAPAMDNEILVDVMESFLKASKVLNIQDEIVDRTAEILTKIPKLKIGKYGQIMEWREDYEEVEPGHRHISQLYALYPSHQIKKDKTPDLAEAAAKTLARRLEFGGGHTGWSCAWITNLYARLQDGENAWKMMQKMFHDSTFTNMMSNHPMGRGYVFQIDGNYGTMAAIQEMLVQSNEERTILLPAIPEEWADGKVSGLVLYGGTTVDMEWKEHKLVKCYLHAGKSSDQKIVINNKVIEIHLNENETKEIILI